MENNGTENISITTAAQLIGVFIAAGFVISIIYDWGFLRALDIGFRDIPTSVSDHFRTGLLWFPPLIAIIIANFAIEFQFQRVEHGLTEEEITESSTNPKNMSMFRNGPFKMFAWTCVLLVVTYPLIGNIPSSA